MKAIDKLNDLDACDEALKWVGDKTVEEAWATCHRGDWMLWFYGTQCPENTKELALVKGHCANTVRHLMMDPRSLSAVDAAIAYGEGKIDLRELKKAASAASASAYAAYASAAAASDAYAAAYTDADADAAYASADADAYAAASAANAAASAAYANDAAIAAASAAASAANAAAYAYADAYADADAAKTQNRHQTADICRKYLTLGDIK